MSDQDDNDIGYEEWMRKALTHGGSTLVVIGLGLILLFNSLILMIVGGFVAFVGFVGLRTGIKGPDTEVVQMVRLFWSRKE